MGSHFIGDVAHQVEQQTENLCVVGSSPTVGTKKFSPGGVMVATLVLEASAEMRVGSSPTWGTTIYVKNNNYKNTK